jgi:hypothetical protein
MNTHDRVLARVLSHAHLHAVFSEMRHTDRRSGWEVGVDLFARVSSYLQLYHTQLLDSERCAFAPNISFHPPHDTTRIAHPSKDPSCRVGESESKAKKQKAPKRKAATTDVNFNDNVPMSQLHEGDPASTLAAAVAAGSLVAVQVCRKFDLSVC